MQELEISAPRRRHLTLPRGGALGGTLLTLAALVLFNLVATPHFTSLQTLYVNLTQVTTIVIVAVGMTMVIATGGIDLSVGSLMAISGALAPLIFARNLLGVGPGPLADVLAFTVPVLVAMGFGGFNGWLVARFRIQPIVATLVLFIAGRGIAQVMTNGNLQAFHNDAFHMLGLGRVLGVPIQVWLMAAIVGIATWVIARIKILVYAISGLLSGIAGLIVIAINSSSDANLVGLGMELDAIAAVAVGGTALTGGRASIIGTLLGALIIQLLRYTLLSHGIPDAAALVVKAAVILVAVYVQQIRRVS